MKYLNLIPIVSLILLEVAACDEPDTIVTDLVHPDGSVSRKIEMRNTKNKFEKSVLQVPFDSTWAVTDSWEIGIKGDTTWIKRAEKVFRNVDEINATYENDSSSNGKFPRYASYSRKFRWFNTSYRFSEIIDKRIASGYSIKKFLNKEELLYFYSPANLKYSKEHGIDSLKYRRLADTVEKKTLDWNLRNVAALWMEEFSWLTAGKAGPDLSADSLKAREGQIINVLIENQQKFDSLWSAGVLLKKFIGERNAIKFKAEADSALSRTIKLFLVDYKDYSVRIVMPGKLTGTNGYIDSTRNLIWPVNADLFFTDQYEMWAESKTPNIWAWILSGAFLVFVLTGILTKGRHRV